MALKQSIFKYTNLQQSYTDQINDAFPDKSMSLKKAGIAALQILTVETDKDIFFVELSGDENFINFQ